MDGYYNLDSVTGSSSPYAPIMPAVPPDSRTILGHTSGQSDNRIIEAKITGLQKLVDFDLTGGEKRFESLARKWKKETIFMSAIDDMAMNKHYQEIIGMGPSVVPHILKRLKAEPDFWFWALQHITRTNPVRKSDMGNLKKMVAAWLKWGRTKGYSV
jgi:hypothetical protein